MQYGQRDNGMYQKILMENTLLNQVFINCLDKW